MIAAVITTVHRIILPQLNTPGKRVVRIRYEKKAN
jgi:hypothetical protein